MPTISESNLRVKVSGTVLSVLQRMSSKQASARPLIGIDSLALVLQVGVMELQPVLKYMEECGTITIYPNLKNKPNGVKLPGKVSLN